MPRRRHPDRDIEKALRYAEDHGWRVETTAAHAHAWGRMYCPGEVAQCRLSENRITSIAGTPRNARHEADHVRRVVDRCRGVCPGLRSED